MASNSIGVPTVKGMKSAFMEGAKGAGAGLVYLLVSQIFGGGLWGAIAAIVLAGSIFKGDTGDMIALMSGFMLFANAAPAAPASSSTAGSTM